MGPRGHQQCRQEQNLLCWGQGQPVNAIHDARQCQQDYDCAANDESRPEQRLQPFMESQSLHIQQ